MEYLGNCSDAGIASIAKGCTKLLNKKWFNAKVKKEFPDMYRDLALEYYNPYRYYQNKKYYVLVHSMIDYVFLKEGL